MHKFYSPWCSLLQHYMDRAKLGQVGFAELVGSTQGTIHTYLCGRSKPPLEELAKWCDLLGLTKDERERFTWAAMEIYTPTVVWEKIGALERVLAATESHMVELEAEIARLRTQIDGFHAEHVGPSDQL